MLDPILAELSTTLPAAKSVEQLTRPLLDMLGAVTGLESTYLTSIDLKADLQHVRYARNVGQLQIPEGLSVPWDDTLCKRALDEGRMCTSDVAQCWPDSDAARQLGIRRMSARRCVPMTARCTAPCAPPAPDATRSVRKPRPC